MKRLNICCKKATCAGSLGSGLRREAHQVAGQTESFRGRAQLAWALDYAALRSIVAGKAAQRWWTGQKCPWLAVDTERLPVTRMISSIAEPVSTCGLGPTHIFNKKLVRTVVLVAERNYMVWLEH